MSVPSLWLESKGFQLYLALQEYLRCLGQPCFEGCQGGLGIRQIERVEVKECQKRRTADSGSLERMKVAARSRGEVEDEVQPRN